MSEYVPCYCLVYDEHWCIIHSSFGRFFLFFISLYLLLCVGTYYTNQIWFMFHILRCSMKYFKSFHFTFSCSRFYVQYLMNDEWHSLKIIPWDISHQLKWVLRDQTWLRRIYIYILHAMEEKWKWREKKTAMLWFRPSHTFSMSHIHA